MEVARIYGSHRTLQQVVCVEISEIIFIYSKNKVTHRSEEPRLSSRRKGRDQVGVQVDTARSVAFQLRSESLLHD